MLMQRLKRRLRAGFLPHRLAPQLAIGQLAVLLLSSFVIFTAQASAVIRFNDRSLFLTSAVPGVTTNYKVSLTYNNDAVYTTTVGSIDLLFCMDPIPYDPCVAPSGLNASGAVLADQTGETGFTIRSASSNHIVLTRTPSAVNETPSTYTFSHMVNPTDTSHSFAIRLSDYPSTDASGALINLGSIVSEITNSIEIDTQVPPMLIFCLARQVSQDCTNTSGGNYTDMGPLSSSETLMAMSQMAVGTNASGGFAITANGTTMQSGVHVITALNTPTVSALGNNQFGINLVANTSPNMGNDPDGPFTNAVVAPGYDTPNEFMYHDGDVVAESPNVSLVRRYTVSYIVNSSPDLHPGVYTTTITFICSGRF